MSGTAAKRKGSQFERDVVAWFRENGFPAERCYGAGRPDDVGDVEIAGLPVVIECKAVKTFDLAGHRNEARAEARNAGVDIGFVVLKAPRRPIEDAYVVMGLSEVAELLVALGCTLRAGGE